MPQTPKQDQLDLFPGMTPAKAAPAIRPWRAALADGWRHGAIERDKLAVVLREIED